MPPGHYISGRTPALHQFALTPQQLQMRERNESGDVGFMLDGSDSDDGGPRSRGSPTNGSSSHIGHISRRSS